MSFPAASVFANPETENVPSSPDLTTNGVNPASPLVPQTCLPSALVPSNLSSGFKTLNSALAKGFSESASIFKNFFPYVFTLSLSFLSWKLLSKVMSFLISPPQVAPSFTDIWTLKLIVSPALALTFSRSKFTVNVLFAASIVTPETSSAISVVILALISLNKSASVVLTNCKLESKVSTKANVV